MWDVTFGSFLLFAKNVAECLNVNIVFVPACPIKQLSF